MSVFVNQGPWPWPPGHTQTSLSTGRRPAQAGRAGPSATRPSPAAAGAGV